MTTPRYYQPPDPPPPPPTVEQLLRELINVVNLNHLAIEPFLPVENTPEVAVHVVEVITPGVPVPAPEVPVVTGVLVVIRQRHHVVNRTGYVSFEGPMGTLNTLTRIEFQDNDALTEKLTSLDDIYFDSDTANTFFEIVFRRSQRSPDGSWAPRA